jgi:hypothetical protein
MRFVECGYQPTRSSEMTWLIRSIQTIDRRSGRSAGGNLFCGGCSRVFPKKNKGRCAPRSLDSAGNPRMLSLRSSFFSTRRLRNRSGVKARFARRLFVSIRRKLRLKHPTGWFAAGREVSRALNLPSDGAFKLYIHLCLVAERSTGRAHADHADLAKVLQKTRRSVVVYLEELRRQGVCSTEPARNQHGQGHIKILDAFWTYERPPAQEKPKNLVDYTTQVRRMLAGRACVRISFSPADEMLAAGLFNRQVPIEVVEHGIALGCTRKYMTLLTTPQSGAITSFSYFQHVIEEAATAKGP